MKVLIIYGEHSGADYARELLLRLTQSNPELELTAIGGAERIKGVHYLSDYNHFCHMFYLAVLSHLPRILIEIGKIHRWCKQQKPDAILFIDSPGLNLHLATKLRPYADKMYYFISPHFWVWKYERIHTFKKIIDRVFPILPFEVRMYEQESIDVTLVNHPKVESIKNYLKQNGRLAGVGANRDSDNVIGLLPGSRRSEISRFIPILVESAQELIKRHRNSGMHFIIPVRGEALDAGLKKYIYRRLGENVTIVEDEFYPAIESCHFCLCASGTASLEVALLRVPMIVFYRLSGSEYFLVNYVFGLIKKIKRVCLVNILLRENIVPEYLHASANRYVLADAMFNLMTRRGLYRRQIESFARLADILSSSRRFSEVISETLIQDLVYKESLDVTTMPS